MSTSGSERLSSAPIARSDRCTVTVYRVSGGEKQKAILYVPMTDRRLGNPFRSVGTGYFEFAVEDGRYDVQMSQMDHATGVTLREVVITARRLEDAAYDSFAAACAAAGLTRMLVVTRSWRDLPSQTCAASLRFVKEGELEPAEGATVRLAGPVNAGPNRIFDTASGGTVRLAGATFAYPQWWGARGDGHADDRPATQAAIDSLLDGGTVCFVPGKYLMDSVVTTRSGDSFNLYTSRDDLRLRSCQGGAENTLIFQGPHGWGTPGRGSFLLALLNAGFFLNSPIGANGYQNTTQNGGYFPLDHARSGESLVTVTSSDRAKVLSAEDWIAITQSMDQTVTPLEINQVTAVNPATGEIRLRWPLTMSYPAAFAAKVTPMVRRNIAIENLTLRATCPLLLNNLIELNVAGSRIEADTTYIGNGEAFYMFPNAVRWMIFRDSSVSSFPEGTWGHPLELPQNNSMNVLVEHNQFLVPSAGTAEYGAHWIVRDNTFRIAHVSPAPPGPSVVFQGRDMVIEGNTVESSVERGTLSDSVVSPDDYGFDFGDIHIRNNHVSAGAGVPALSVYYRDTEITGNTVGVGPRGKALSLMAGDAANMVKDNSFSCAGASDFGCVFIAASKTDGIAFTQNTLTGTGGASVGIFVADLPQGTPRGRHLITGNRISGFLTPVLLNRDRHPATTVR